MNFGFSTNFIETVLSELTPFQHLSGTEHVGPLLYSLIRMLRPGNVVEFGTGFTTPFILQALKDNAEDFKLHQNILKKKAVKNFTALSDEKRRDLSLDDWWAEEATQEVYGKEPILPQPSYYLQPYNPHLTSFELLPEDDAYVQKLSNIISMLKLNTYFTLEAGIRVTGYTDFDS